MLKPAEGFSRNVYFPRTKGTHLKIEQRLKKAGFAVFDKFCCLANGEGVTSIHKELCLEVDLYDYA